MPPEYDARKGRLFTWMAQIARNTALDRVKSAAYKKGQRTDGLSAATGGGMNLSTTLSITDSGLKKVVDNLDEGYRVLIDYAYFPRVLAFGNFERTKFTPGYRQNTHSGCDSTTQNHFER